MFVNDKNIMMTARNFSKLVLIEINFVDEETFILNGPLMDEGCFKLPSVNETEKIKSSVINKIPKIETIHHW